METVVYRTKTESPTIVTLNEGDNVEVVTYHDIEQWPDCHLVPLEEGTLVSIENGDIQFFRKVEDGNYYQNVTNEALIWFARGDKFHVALRNDPDYGEGYNFDISERELETHLIGSFVTGTNESMGELEGEFKYGILKQIVVEGDYVTYCIEYQSEETGFIYQYDCNTIDAAHTSMRPFIPVYDPDTETYSFKSAHDRSNELQSEDDYSNDDNWKDFDTILSRHRRRGTLV